MSVRFAPSPTGRFHVGNLRTAWISWRWAKHLNQPWIVRFEDIDAPRVLAGAQTQQLADMAALGLVPDEVRVQSANHGRHWHVFLEAVRARQVYPCFCSRKEVAEALQGAASAPHKPEAVYDGRCRSRTSPPDSFVNPTLGWRFRNSDPSGAQDFIVARTDPFPEAPKENQFVPAYHWACAVDDWDGKHTLLVRAWDLYNATEQQRAIQSWLAQANGMSPEYSAVFHTSLVVNNDGGRLEKRTLGVTLPELAEAGIGTEEILRSFTHSFQSPLHFAPGKVWGEALEKLPLSLLFP